VREIIEADQRKYPGERPHCIAAAENSSEPVPQPYKATVGVNTQDCTIRK